MRPTQLQIHATFYKVKGPFTSSMPSDLPGGRGARIHPHFIGEKWSFRNWADLRLTRAPDSKPEFFGDATLPRPKRVPDGAKQPSSQPCPPADVSPAPPLCPTHCQLLIFPSILSPNDESLCCLCPVQYRVHPPLHSPPQLCSHHPHSSTTAPCEYTASVATSPPTRLPPGPRAGTSRER